jgi:hypothetical protein
MESKLVGYARKSKNGGALKLNLDYEAIKRSEKYTTQDGRKYVALIANLSKLEEIIDGTREVTSVCQLIGDSE